MSDSEYDLTVSKKGLGALYPILKDAHGNIIDGFHRQNADPAWPVRVVLEVQTPEQLELARLVANNLRRKIPETETQQRIAFLVKAGLKPDEIAQKTGLSKTTVYKYMPQELKDEKHVEIGRAAVGSHANQTVKTPDTPRFAECERCHINTTEPKTWHGHILCTRCERKANFNPEAYDGWFKYQERANLIPKAKATVPAVDSWKDREARIHPQKSKMEEELLLIIGNDEALRPVVTDRSFPIVSLTPDFVLTRHNLAIFVDGKHVHNHRQDRDKELRQKLSDRHGLKVLSITYDGNSDAEKQRIIAEIKGAV